MLKKLIILGILINSMVSFNLLAQESTFPPFDPEIDCTIIDDEGEVQPKYYSPYMGSTVEYWFLSVDDKAIEKEDKFVVCFKIDDPVTFQTFGIANDQAIIKNPFPKPLFVYGLNIEKPANTYEPASGDNSSHNVIDVAGDNIVLLNLNLSSSEEIGVRVSGNNNLIKDIDIDSENMAVLIDGTGNRFIQSKITAPYGIKVAGSNNIVEDIEITKNLGDYSELIGVEIDGYESQVASTTIDGFENGIKTGCNWADAEQPQNKTSCTIGPGNNILNVDYGIYVKEGASNITIRKNSIDSDKDTIYFDGIHKSKLHPFNYDAIGLIDHDEENGLYHVVGGLNDLTEFTTKGGVADLYKGVFEKECLVTMHVGEPLDVLNSFGNVKYTFDDGEYYFNCGYVSLKSSDDFQFIFTDKSGNSTLPSIPINLETDTSGYKSAYDCPYSIVDLSQISLEDVINNLEDHTVDYKDQLKLCFDEKTDIDLESNLIITNDDKDINIFGLNIGFAPGALNLNPNQPIIILNGDGLKLIDFNFKGSDINGEPAAVALFMSGSGHELINSQIENVHIGLRLSGSDHRVSQSVMSNCDIGIHADCSWSEFQPACTIGPANEFINISENPIYLPSTSNQVTITGNSVLEFGGLLEDVLFFESGANEDTQPQDKDETGILFA